MRSFPAENRDPSNRDQFEIEHERHCDFRLVYNVPKDEVSLILQPARRRHVARTAPYPLTLDFDEEGLMIGVQLGGPQRAGRRSRGLDLTRALQPFANCDNITMDSQIGYVHLRTWDNYGDDEVAFVMEVDGHLDLASDGGLIAVRLPRSAPDYEFDPFAAFWGLTWHAEVEGGDSLSQYGLY